MPGLNKVQLIGRLGRDPESKTVKNQTVTTFGVAVNRAWKGADGEQKETTDWFNVEVWGSLAQTCKNHLSKGRLVYVEGRLQTDRFEGDDGRTRYYTKVVAHNVQFLDRRPEADSEDVPDDIE